MLKRPNPFVLSPGVIHPCHPKRHQNANMARRIDSDLGAVSVASLIHMTGSAQRTGPIRFSLVYQIV